MSFKDYLLKTCGIISEERFDETAELACKGLSDSELFGLFVSYGRANREGRMTDKS